MSNNQWKPMASSKNLDKFMAAVSVAFKTDKKSYNKLIPALFKRFDLNKVVEYIIKSDNVDLLEDVLSYDVDICLDLGLIDLAVDKWRISMIKCIYEFNGTKLSEYYLVEYIFCTHKIDYRGQRVDEKSIDECILTMVNGFNADYIIPYIDCSIWDNFLIRYACETDQLKNVRLLLSDMRVDPAVDCDILVRNAIIEGKYELANELMKHPFVSVENVDQKFVDSMIQMNWIHVAEKVMKNDECLPIFKKWAVLERLYEECNDVSVLAVQLGIIDINKLNPKKIKKIKRHMKNLGKVDTVYVPKPYVLCLDPTQIYVNALEENDLDTIKSIENYSISINSWVLFYNLEKHTGTTKICSYIIKHRLAEYEPEDLCVPLKSSMFDLDIEHAIMKKLANHKYDPTEFLISHYDDPRFRKMYAAAKSNPNLDHAKIELSGILK